MTQVQLKNPKVAALLAWLVPGLGHLYQGRTRKGVLYMVSILGLYVIGLLMGECKTVYWTWISPLKDPENFRFSYLCQFWVGLGALPGLVQAILKAKGFDPVLWGFLAEPTTNAVNALHPKLGKLVEVSWMYTVIAGLLNLLAIYDAYEGPAYDDSASDPGQVEVARAPELAAKAGAA